jgi:hypothetical protein
MADLTLLRFQVGSDPIETAGAYQDVTKDLDQPIALMLEVVETETILGTPDWFHCAFRSKLSLSNGASATTSIAFTCLIGSRSEPFRIPSRICRYG